MKSLLASKKNNHLHYFTFIVSTACCLFSNAATAQITPDTTLPNNSQVQSSGNIIEITKGTNTGNNLFHSFDEFSVPTNNTAFFNNPTTIENIIGRVTGSSISHIDGLIRANGEANLFLINPNGIVFGENAALDLGGSFIGSTADSIQFADGSEFSAVNPDEPPLLKVNIPLGLQFGDDSGDITVKGTGHNAWFDFYTYTVDRFERNRGLEVAPENTIGLIGNNIFLEGGNLTVESGNIELGSVAEAGTVEIIPNDLGWTFDYGDLNGENINLADAASIDVSGKGSGNIQIYGDSVNITDGSAIFAETEADARGGLTTIKAKEVNIIGTDADIYLPSSIWSDVYLDATGDGGSVSIDTESLLLEAGGQVNTNTYSLGNAGNLTVRATDIKVIGESEFGDFISGLFAQADILLTGKGGDIAIKTDNLLVRDGAQIATTTFGEGDAGNLTIEAKDIKLIGDTEFGASGLFANTDFEALGKGGNLKIETDNLLVKDGAQIAAIAFGEGDAGNLTIKAKDIELTGASEFGVSGLLSSTEAQGNGGNLDIDTGSLKITDGAQIIASTFGSGNAGSINITAADINLSGSSELAASGIFATALVDRGNGGNLNIETGSLSIQDGATISTSNFFSRGNGEPGQGKAGNINIKANSLQIDNRTSELPSSITASTNHSGGGDIQLNIANNLTLNNNSEITADTKGDGNGGSIEIVAPNLNINNQAQISVDSIGFGQAGNIDLTVKELSANQGKITATSEKSGGGNINLTTDFIDLQNNSEISTSVFGGTGGGGDITIDSNYILGRNNSDIRANAVEGNGGNINITTDAILLSFDSEVDASSQFGLDGVVKINNPDNDRQISGGELSQKIVDPTALIMAVCPVKDAETLVTTGKGGLAENPGQNLRGESVWEDLRNVADLSKPADNSEIIEAKAWNINQQGKVELLGYIPQQSKGDYWASFNQCRQQ